MAQFIYGFRSNCKTQLTLKYIDLIHVDRVMFCELVPVVGAVKQHQGIKRPAAKELQHFSIAITTVLNKLSIAQIGNILKDISLQAFCLRIYLLTFKLIISIWINTPQYKSELTNLKLNVYIQFSPKITNFNTIVVKCNIKFGIKFLVGLCVVPISKL